MLLIYVLGGSLDTSTGHDPFCGARLNSFWRRSAGYKQGTFALRPEGVRGIYRDRIGAGLDTLFPAILAIKMAPEPPGVR